MDDTACQKMIDKREMEFKTAYDSQLDKLCPSDLMVTSEALGLMVVKMRSEIETLKAQLAKKEQR